MTQRYEIPTLLRRRVRPADWFGASCIAYLVLCLAITLSSWAAAAVELMLVTAAGAFAYALQWAAVKQVTSKPVIWFLGAPSLGVAAYTGRRLCEVLDVQSGRAALLFGPVAGLIVAVSSSAIVDVCIFHDKNDVASTLL